MSKEKIRVLVIKHNEEPEVIEIPNDYKAMQGIVDGRIEFMPFDAENEACELMVNEEYLINGSEFNRYIQSDYHTVENGGATAFGVPIMGTFAVVRNDFETGESISLTDEDIAKYTKVFRL